MNLGLTKERILPKPITDTSRTFHALYLKHDVKCFGVKIPAIGPLGEPYLCETWWECSCGAKWGPRVNYVFD